MQITSKGDVQAGRALLCTGCLHHGYLNNTYSVTGIKAEAKNPSGGTPYKLTDVSATRVSRSPGTNSVDRTVPLTNVNPVYVSYFTAVDDTTVSVSAHAVLNDNSRVLIFSFTDSGDNGSGGWKQASRSVYLDTIAALANKTDEIKAIECHASGSWNGNRATDGYYADIYIYVTENTWQQAP